MRLPGLLLLRLLWSRPLPSKISTLSINCKGCRRLSNLPAQHKFEAADMGKEKVQFQLKTPKGTKDCERIRSTGSAPTLTLR